MSLHFLARELGIWNVKGLARAMPRSAFLDWEAMHEIERKMIARARRQAQREARSGGGQPLSLPETLDG